jgi:DNA-binding MarR family transcriptional regulator
MKAHLPRLYTSAVSSDPWLSVSQQAAWRAFLTMSGELSERIERDLHVAAGMPHAYYIILVSLSEAPDGSLRMNQLARAARSSQSRLSHAVARLEESGWVRRTPAPGDRRGQVAELTPAGRAELERVAPGHAETVRSTVFDGLDDEQVADLRHICEIITARLTRDHHPDQRAG